MIARVRTRVRQWWELLHDRVVWTRPTSTEIGTVVKSGLAAGLAWLLAGLITDLPDPLLAPLTAIVVVQVSVRSSVKSALQRSSAVVIGVFIALLLGDALGLNAITIALVVVLSLGVAQLGLRLPPAAARQVPISILVVLSTVASLHASSAWQRALSTVIGAVVGVVVSFVLPASRLVDARQTLERLGASLGDILDEMGEGLRDPWTAEQTQGWRREARTARERLVAQAVEAVGNSKEAAKWNVRDLSHVDELGRYEEVMPRLERTAIGVSVIARGLDDHARISGAMHEPMRHMGLLLTALASVVRAVVDEVLHDPPDDVLDAAFDDLAAKRSRCAVGASRKARMALDHEQDDDDESRMLEGEWLNYAAVLVQVDRIVVDLRAPLPT